MSVNKSQSRVLAVKAADSYVGHTKKPTEEDKKSVIDQIKFVQRNAELFKQLEVGITHCDCHVQDGFEE